MPIAFDNSYARLPPRFFARGAPTPVAAPALVYFNDALAEELGIGRDQLDLPMLAGNRLPAGSDPLAMAYAGHQFGQFVPQLGDGRAILMGEVIDRQGQRRDIQWKGSGMTAFSRRGDGRAALGPVLREYLVSEAMAVYGIPTTRALAVLTTGEPVYRERPLPGGLLIRVASSHVRIGSFQFFAARGDEEAVRHLADYVIDRHYPTPLIGPERYRFLLAQVIGRQAALVAGWLLIGFIHGVMNTDNMSVSGETIDFGPCAFMDGFDPMKLFSSIDHAGRYAYGNQPRIAQWNLARFAETLLPLLHDQEEQALALAQSALEVFPAVFDAAYRQGLARKLGFFTERPEDLALGQEFLRVMADEAADFTLCFRGLCALAEGGEDRPRALFANPAAYLSWRDLWLERLAAEGGDPARRAQSMRHANPAIIPRNHRIEAAIRAAEDGDFAPFHALRQALEDPLADREDLAAYQKPPLPEEEIRQTFCGT